MDLKSTLNLPDADFTIPMKADLPQLEPRIQARWAEIGIYERIIEARKNSEAFVLHDGPPYTNGPIHIGTAMNKVLKDFVFKSRTVMGYRAPNVPGYDNHGLPIEQAVMRKFHEKGEHPDVLELRRACREHAAKFIKVQTEQFERLGTFGMWDRPYCTMDYRFEAEILRVFKRIVEGGYVYRGLRPVLWSPTSQTALADTEIVYQEHTSQSIFVRFPLLADTNKLFEGLDRVYTIIWTTTPWTIPANLAVAFHPWFTYVVVKHGGEHYVLLEELLERTMAKVGFKQYEVVKTLKGSELEGTKFKHPVFKRESVAVLAEYVTTEDGTGVVHTAPGHGREDFVTGKRYDLPVLCPVDEKGILTAEAGEFAGISYKKADEVVVERLRELGALMHDEPYVHSYPHAERDGKPVIFRATEQWFVGLDAPFHADPSKTLREAALEAIDSINEAGGWHPASSYQRIRGMIAGRPDWCISRQRPWGVGIPVFYGAESGEPVLDPAAIDAVAALVEREGSDAWFDKAPAGILPKGYKHPVTGETEFRKETDVFDVWFDSGSTSLCVLEGNVEPRWKDKWPCDLYLEGSDQHRGWFNVSLIIGLAARGQAPYRAVATHGWVMDEKGMKMSKRLGNVVDPVHVCEHSGADILRIWAASVNYEDDVPCSDHILKQVGEVYRRMRNTLRFLLSNLYDFVPGEDVELLPIDRWIVEKSEEMAASALGDYRDYSFSAVVNRIHNFCVNELSSFYLDAIKDRMYCDGKDWPSRKSGQVASYRVLRLLLALLSPILVHTTEETYAKLPGERLESVHMEQIEPKPDEELAEFRSSDVWSVNDLVTGIRSVVFAEFEKAKIEQGVKDSQDVSVRAGLGALGMDGKVLQRLRALCESLGIDPAAELALVLKVSEFEFLPEGDGVEFRLSEHAKCDRCRLRRPDVKPHTLGGQTVKLCDRCGRAAGV